MNKKEKSFYEAVEHLHNCWKKVMFNKNYRSNIFHDKDKTDISKGFELDPTGITSYLLLEKRAITDLNNIVVNASYFLDDSFIELQEDIKVMIEALDENSLLSMKGKYLEHLLSTVDFYKGMSIEAQNEVVNTVDFPKIRLSALKEVDNLKLDQFSSGIFTSDKATFNQDILIYKNINDAINELSQREDGVQLVGIDHASSDLTGFAFLIKNGQNIYTLSNLIPLSEKIVTNTMLRNRDERTNHIYTDKGSEYFPYKEVFDLKEIPTTAGNYYFRRKDNFKETRLSVLSNKGALVSNLSILKIENIIWIANMIQLIDNKFFKNKLTLNDMSYTLEMSVNENSTKLIENNLNLPIIKNDLPKVEKLTLDELFKLSFGENYQELIAYKQFKDKISMDHILLISENYEKYSGISYDGFEFESFNQKSAFGEAHFNETRIKKGELDWFKVRSLAEVFTESFMTKKRIEEEVIKVQLFNFRVQISMLKEHEFYKNILPNRQWIFDNISEDILKEIVIAQEYMVNGENKLEFNYSGKNNQNFSTTHFIESCFFDKDYLKEYSLRSHSMPIVIGSDLPRHIGRRYVNYDSYSEIARNCMIIEGAKPTLSVKINLDSWEDILYVTGKSEDQLPEFLKNYYSNGDGEYGRYFDEFNYSILIPFSKKGYMKLFNDKNIKPTKFWLENK